MRLLIQKVYFMLYKHQNIINIITHTNEIIDSEDIFHAV